MTEETEGGSQEHTETGDDENEEERAPIDEGDENSRPASPKGTCVCACAFSASTCYHRLTGLLHELDAPSLIAQCIFLSSLQVMKLLLKKMARQRQSEQTTGL